MLCFSISICPVSSFGSNTDIVNWCILYFLILKLGFILLPGSFAWIQIESVHQSEFGLLIETLYQCWTHSDHRFNLASGLFTIYFLACLFFLMLKDAILTNAKWPDVRLSVHEEIFWRMIFSMVGKSPRSRTIYRSITVLHGHYTFQSPCCSLNFLWEEYKKCKLNERWWYSWWITYKVSKNTI